MIVHARSAVFLVWFIAVSVVMNVGCLPLLLAPRRAVVDAGRLWARLILWGLKWIAGLRFEIRGQRPKPFTRAFIAAKHFSMWETIAFMALHPDPAIVIKRELLFVPFYGWYCLKMGMIPIDRSSGGKAIRIVLAAARRAADEERPIIIFPEGTRKKTGDPPDYKPGVAALYAGLGLACVPVVHNSGLYWQGWFTRRPGAIVVEYLEPIPPGLKRQSFMEALQASVEEASHRLAAETAQAIGAVSV